MDALTNIIASISSSVANQVGGAITSVLSYIVNGVQNDVIAPVTTGIDNTLSAVEKSVNALSTAASNGIESTLTAASNSIGTFISASETGLQTVIGGVESGVQSLASSITSVFQNVVAGVEQGFTSISGAVGGAIAEVGTAIQNGLDEFSTEVTDVFTPIFSGITQFIEGLPQDLATIAGDVVDALTGLGKMFQPVLQAVDDDLTRKLPAAAEAYIAGVELREKVVPQSKVTNQLPQLIQEMLGIAPSDDLSISLGRISLIAGLEAAIGMVEELFPGAAFIMAELLNHIADAVAVGDFRTLQQAGNQGTPNQLLDLGEAVRGRYRGNVSDGDYYDTLAKSGYTKARADVIYSNAAVLLGLTELVMLYKRGEIATLDELYNRATTVQVTSDQVDEALILYEKLFGAGEAIQMWRRGIVVEGDTTSFDDLIRSGFTKERITALQNISYNLPAIEQLKEFIIRDVDDETTAQKYGYDQGLTQTFLDDAAKLGWTPDQAKRIYRTTWQLPPFFILHTMYAAGKINADDFSALMQQQGFAPYWAKQFVTSLAPALTQGDIKDMYKYEVITADQIVTQLESIGTPTALAEQLSELWQASVKQASPQDQTASQTTAAALKGETEGLIKTAYKDGLLDNPTAESQLIALGKTEEAAKLILSIADYELAQQNIKDVFAMDKENYLAGNIGINDVMTDLSAAGANTTQLNKYFTQLQYAGRSKPKSPTLAEFEKWFKNSVITVPEFIASLQLLGYSDTWIPFYLVEAGVDPTAVTEMGYTLSIPLPSN
jgi:hypothetical protein